MCYVRSCYALFLGVENELLVERQQMQQLRTDFEYNLGLLEQRDRELSQYDLAFTEVKRVIGTLAAENSELKVTQVCRQCAFQCRQGTVS